LRFKKHWQKILLAIFGLLLIWVGTLAIQIVRYSGMTTTQNAHAGIVLGAAVWNARPSPVFEERINHAINLYTRGDIQFLIFTGGKGDGDALSEAQVGKNYAIENGVLPEHIFIETQSRTTVENLEEAKNIVDQQGFGRVLIISDPLHMKRAMVISDDLGLNGFPSPTPTSKYRTWKSKSGFLIREIYFLSKYYLQQAL